MHDTFMFTKPVDFSVALGAADLDATNSARKIALSTTMHRAMDGALLTETFNLGAEDVDDTVELPMTDTTYILPAEKTTVNNALFNTDGNSADKYSLVTRYLSLSDFVEKTTFEVSDTTAEQHNARSSQHASAWVVFTMGVNKTKNDIDTKRRLSPTPKGAAFSFNFGWKVSYFILTHLGEHNFYSNGNSFSSILLTGKFVSRSSYLR